MTQRKTEIIQTRLRNGLEIRLKPVHTAPLVSAWIWYRVGSRNEIAGTTGASHFVEHMQFNGTPRFPIGSLDRIISRDGGISNALTWVDWTAYFATMPTDRIDLALQIEADRMQNSNFDPRQVERERTVIISERQGHENEPTFRLAEELQAVAFRVHGYHHETIGDMADLETMSRDALYEHYRRHYVPSNAVLAVVGDFSVSPMLNRIRKLFGDIPRAPKPEVFVRPEPVQFGERQVTVEGPGDTPYLFTAYHAPPASHPDFFVLTVLGSVLAGAASMNLFSGGISNKTSRLYRALVEGEIAAAVRGGLAATIDPYLYSINVTLRPDRDPKEALECIDREIEAVLEKVIDPRELEKANKQARALFAYSSESITNQGFWLGFTEMFADQSWFENYLTRLKAVTLEDVHAAAQRYLRSSNRVVGMYRPVNGSNHG